MEIISKTNKELLKNAYEVDKAYQQEHDGEHMFTEKFVKMLEHFNEGDFKDMPAHMVNAELNKILKPVKGV